MPHATQKLTIVSPKKHVVRFDADEKDKLPLFSGVYLSREAAKKKLGIKDLDDAVELELTIRVKTGSKRSRHDEDEEDND